MSNKLKGFFGYGSDHRSSGESIEKAVLKLNESPDYEILTWRKLAKGGGLVIKDILRYIEQCDFTCYDLTGMNQNVLYEIGFSLAKRKPVWLIFDTSIEESVRIYDQLGLLRDITYASYSNDGQIVEAFIRDKPFAEKEILSRLLENYVDPEATPNVLLWLKQQVDTTASNSIFQAITTRKIPVIIDDPAESKVQNLSWYVQNIWSSIAVLVELSSNYRSGNLLQNSKCSFVAGFAHGLDKKTLMVAELPYRSPSDYKNYVKTYETTLVLNTHVVGFLNDVKSKAVEVLVTPKKASSINRKKSDLQTVSFGEYIAEHEKSKLYDYYVETKAIKSLIKNEYNIIIGRKGCGKTASFYFLGEELASDVRNIVCIIKPISFEIDALLSLLKSAQEDFQKYYLIEATWKFLIFTEVARSLYERISSKQSYALTEAESEFIDYVNHNKNVILVDFSTRLETQLEAIKKNIDPLINDSQEGFKENISQLLHGSILYKITSFIADLAPKSGRIVVLMDNLDKSWRIDNDLSLLSQWILGLLSVSGRIAKQISFVKQKQVQVDFNLTIFLRSDILKYVMKFAREPDKIEKTELKYDDKEVLLRILNERFVRLNPEHETASEFWDKYVVENVKGQPIDDYIFTNILPRPRDLLYFVRHAKDTAVARGHSIIGEGDLIKAYEIYSEWILTSLFVENGITQQQMEDFLYNLVGTSQIVTEDDIKVAMQLANIDKDVDSYIDYFIDHLVALSVLGREISIDKFTFEYDLNVDKRNKILASRMDSKRYKVHNALVPALHLVAVNTLP